MADEIIFNSKSKLSDLSDSDDASFENRPHEKTDVFKFEMKKKTLSEKERKELEEVYKRVVVNDYNDSYHMSEEERAKRSKYYEAFSKITKYKRKYKKLDEFIKVYRECLKVLDIVAEDNGIYPIDKFKTQVLKGKIKVFGLNFPKYTGRDKKYINWKYVTEFILDDTLDITEFSQNRETELSDLDDDELIEFLFTDEELEALERSIIESKDEDGYVSYEDEQNEEFMAEVMSSKESKEFIKQFPEVLKTIKDSVKEEKRKARVRNGVMGMFSWNQITEDDFEAIEELDKSYGYKSDSNIPEFEGDIMNSDDVSRYMYQLEEYEKNEIKVNYNGKMRTRAEINEIELKNALEEAGWNMRVINKKHADEKKLKKIRKKDKKREDEIKKKLIKYGKKSNSELEFNSKKKAKKKKKKKKKEDD